jgi:hypothetical protein
MLRAHAAWLWIAFVGCTSGDSRSSPKPDAGGSHEAGPSADAGPTDGVASAKFDPAAAAELEALGYRQFEGKAVITNEVPQSEAWPARVTFDRSSGPVCLYGQPYSAYYADRSSEDLIIVLDGGGACWTNHCNAAPWVEPMLSRYAQLWAYPLETHWEGALQAPAVLDEFRNFATWNLVSAPYCDGSLFMGRGDVQEESGRIRQQHGRQNLAAALDLAVKHFPDPKRILLAGFSAGGFGTIPGALSVRLRYPNAELFVLNDSGPGLANPANDMADMEQRSREWNTLELIPPSCEKCRGDAGPLAALVSWTLDHDAQIRMSLASYTHDPVISTSLGLSADAYSDLLQRTAAEFHDAYPARFKRYLVAGTTHVLGALATADDLMLANQVVAMTSGDAAWIDLVASGAALCVHPDAESCVAAPGCRVVEGQDAHGNPKGFQGCISSARTCKAQETCATNLNYTLCYAFADSCVPTGWAPIACDHAACKGKPFVDELPDCALETVLDYIADGVATISCGDISLDGSGADPAAVVACALDAQAAARSFRVTSAHAATPEELRAANKIRSAQSPASAAVYHDGVLGTNRNGSFTTYRVRTTKTFQPDNPDIIPESTWTACAAGSRLTPCGQQDDPACLTCEPDSRVQCECVVRPFGSDAAYGVACTGAAR